LRNTNAVDILGRMRIAPTTSLNIADVEANQRIIDDDGKRWIVDYIVKRADKVEAFCFPVGREASRRTSRDYKPNDMVTVELSPEVGQAILNTLIRALRMSPVVNPESDASKPSVKPEITIEVLEDDHYLITGTKPHVWQLELEP
jgi:hypothetical protein